MRVGFTGTRTHATDAQLAWLYGVFEQEITELHHGACQGADATAHTIALENGVRIHVWPPTNLRLCATECLVPDPLVTVHPRMPYLNRDREIVAATTGLIAVPKQNRQPPPEEWGGTWYTVDYAERMNKPVTIVYPSGELEQRMPNNYGRQQ